MDKQTFYTELTKRLTDLELSQEYIDRHISQFDGYFSGKSEDQISSEISKLGDLDRVAARIKRMTDKAISEAMAKQDKRSNTGTVNSDSDATSNSDISSECSTSLNDKNDDNIDFIEDDVRVSEMNDISTDCSNEMLDGFERSEEHCTKRGGALADASGASSIKPAPIDPEVIEKNRKKFWTVFAVTSPLIIIVLAATASVFAFTFFCIAMLILIATGLLVVITAGGTAVTLFGLIFGVSQMINNVPIGLYECGIAISIGAVCLFVGILVYNFAVRLMPYAAKWLLVFMKYVIRKYRELFVYLKKECIGL